MLKPSSKRLVKIPRPFPSEIAQRGLTKVKNIEVAFAKNITKAEQTAVLEHLDELIAWWDLPTRQWDRARIAEREGDHGK